MPRTFAYAIITVAMATTATAETGFRTALRAAVAACELNFNLTRIPFPCLKLQHSSQPLHSYAVLREPTGERRTILSPIADERGIKDASLLEKRAPNKFARA